MSKTVQFFENNIGNVAFCKSKLWDARELDNLGLLGLTPCFEDICLLTPIHLVFIYLSIRRMNQIRSKPYKHTAEFTRNLILKVLLCIGNLITTVAPFEVVTYVLATSAWLLLILMLIKEATHFDWLGQWVQRFCFFWTFVCYAIRWPTQAALGHTQSGDIYFKCFLVSFSLQALLVCLLYFERSVTKTEFLTRVTSRAVQDMDEGDYTPGVITIATTTTTANNVSRENSVQKAVQLTRLPSKYSSKRSAPLKKQESVVDYGSCFPMTARSSSVQAVEPPAYELLDDDSESVHAPSWSPHADPERRAWLLSRLTFDWLTPLLVRGQRHTLEAEDCWPLQGDLRSAVSYAKFDSIWKTEILSAAAHSTRPSLLRAIRKAFLWEFSLTVPLLVMQNICQLALPFTLGPLIQFMHGNQPSWIGYLYAFGFFVGIFSTTLFENQFFDICSKTGVKLRGALVPLIFRHSMRLSNTARQERSVGAIVNHVSSDVEKIQMQTFSINNLWSSPMRLLLGLVILVRSLGWAGIFGFLSVLLLVPMQTRLMTQMSNSIREVAKSSDARMKLVNEVLSGMRVIKYYAWEDPFQRKMQDIRSEELEKLTTTQRIRALNIFFINLNPALLAMATFLAFALMRGNISPEQAFQAAALFQQLLWPLMLFPRSVSDFMEALISLRRVEDFLLSEVVDDVMLLQDTPLGADNWPKKDISYVRIPDAPPAIEIENASFAWGVSSSSQLSLTDISLSVKPGSLVAVVGGTGSGKSSLISAILGDLSVVVGRAKLMGKVAYIPQQAWIFNATVRDNITFGLPFNLALYNQAIDASQLRSDIEKQFVGGDECEIGEKGINLSGGQRQRVNIARGVYADADVYLFDDPLSALDAHVTAAVFRDCIKKQLRGKTIVLVTNQLHLMPDMDWIVVMKQGRICEQGTFSTLNARTAGELHRLYEDLATVSHENSSGAIHGVEEDSGVDSKSKSPLQRLSSEKSVSRLSDDGDRDRDCAPHFLRTQDRSKSSMLLVKAMIKKTAENDSLEQKKKDVGKLVQAEGMSVGTVHSDVYIGYAKAVGLYSFVWLIFLYIAGTAFQLMTSVWLSYWSSSAQTAHHGVMYFIGIYICLTMVSREP